MKQEIVEFMTHSNQQRLTKSQSQKPKIENQKSMFLHFELESPKRLSTSARSIDYRPPAQKRTRQYFQGRKTKYNSQFNHRTCFTVVSRRASIASSSLADLFVLHTRPTKQPRQSEQARNNERRSKHTRYITITAVQIRVRSMRAARIASASVCGSRRDCASRETKHAGSTQRNATQRIQTCRAERARRIDASTADHAAASLSNRCDHIP